MKIFIPFKVRETGGTSTFAKKFKKGLEGKGHEVFFDFRPDYDVLFVIILCNPLYLLHAKLNKRKIIHRLDGVYYWSVAKWKYPLLNFAPKFIHKFFSDFTVYQSRYSKYCADKFLRKRKDEKCTIIYNGVNSNLFSQKGETIENLRDNPGQALFITVSKFRREDQIIPIIRALEIYKNRHHGNFKLLILGDFNGKIRHIPSKFGQLEYLKFLGKIKNELLPAYLRTSDCFLMTHLNPPCPNNVIEAMACGLPICGVADGAMKEITSPERNSLLIEAEGDAFWKKRDYNHEEFAKNLNVIVNNKTYYSENSRKIAEERFSLDNMVNEYLKLFL